MQTLTVALNLILGGTLKIHAPLNRTDSPFTYNNVCIQKANAPHNFMKAPLEKDLETAKHIHKGFRLSFCPDIYVVAVPFTATPHSNSEGITTR